MSERMSDARAAALFERLRIVARGESSFTASSMEAIIEDWRRARAAEAALAEELERVAANRAELASAVAERDAERALVRQLREESARRLRGLKDAEATLRPEELPTGHRDLWSAAEYRMRKLDAERARADLAEQAQQAYAAKNAKLAEDLAAEHAEVIRLQLDVKAERARTEMVGQTRDGLRAALKGLSDERWWPDRQSHGPCWCAYNSADWVDHAPRCRRAAEALGEGDE